MGMNTKAAAAGGLRGKASRVGVVLGTKATSLVLLLVIYYMLVFFAAIQLVPLTMGFVKAGSRVTMSMPIETVVSLWIVPALFLVALEFVLVLVAIRALWRARRRLVDTVAGWAFGREAAATPVDISSAKPKGARSRTTRAV